MIAGRYLAALPLALLLHSAQASPSLTFSVDVLDAVHVTYPDIFDDQPFTPNHATASTAFAHPTGSHVTPLLDFPGLIQAEISYDASLLSTSVYQAPYLAGLMLPVTLATVVNATATFSPTGSYSLVLDFSTSGLAALPGGVASSSYDIDYRFVTVGSGAADLLTITALTPEIILRLWQAGEDPSFDYHEQYANIVYGPDGSHVEEAWLGTSFGPIAVSISAVPEPATVGLLAAGLLVGGWSRRRPHPAAARMP